MRLAEVRRRKDGAGVGKMEKGISVAVVDSGSLDSEF